MGPASFSLFCHNYSAQSTLWKPRYNRNSMSISLSSLHHSVLLWELQAYRSSVTQSFCSSISYRNYKSVSYIISLIPLSYENYKLTPTDTTTNIPRTLRQKSSGNYHITLSFPYNLTTAVSPVAVSWAGSGAEGDESGASTVQILSWGPLGSELRVAADRLPPSLSFRTHSHCGHLSEPAPCGEEWEWRREALPHPPSSSQSPPPFWVVLAAQPASPHCLAS